MADVHNFAKAAFELYGDKLVEVNTGESATSLQYADHEVGQKHVIRGYLRRVIGDGLVLECNVNSNKQDILINVWSIISIMELRGNGNISDVYIDEYQERINIRNVKRRNK